VAQREYMNVYRSDSAEIQELLLQILTNTNEMRRVADMERAGQHVAGPIMHAGQLVSAIRSIDHQADVLKGTCPFTRTTGLSVHCRAKPLHIAAIAS
jgi:hypothetical protein